MRKTLPPGILAAVVAAAAAVLTGCTSGAIGTSSPTGAPPTVAAPSTPAATATSAQAATSPSGASPTGATCTPTGTALHISAHNITYDKNCLAAPAGTSFTITFDNMDSGVPHNVDIYTNSSATKSLFKGSIVTGPKTVTYQVPALPAGTYYFRCDIHPTQMFGTFIVS